MTKASGIVDMKKVKLSEGDGVFFSLIKARPKDKVNMPTKGLLRFQFVEACIRLAMRKFQTTTSGDSDDISKAMEMMFEENIQKTHTKIDPNPWREK
jgi:hypothetical protein